MIIRIGMMLRSLCALVALTTVADADHLGALSSLEVADLVTTEGRCSSAFNKNNSVAQRIMIEEKIAPWEVLPGARDFENMRRKDLRDYANDPKGFCDLSYIFYGPFGTTRQRGLLDYPNAGYAVRLTAEMVRDLRDRAENSIYRDDHMPLNKKEGRLQSLYSAYRLYAIVQQCHKVRQGYVLVYINDVEMERARTAVKYIEDSAMPEIEDVPTKSIWDKAVQNIKGAVLIRDVCQMRLQELLQRAPQTALEPQKDF